MTCEHCGQRIRKLNPHRMDRDKVTALEILAKAHVEGHAWVRIEAGRGYEYGGVKRQGPYRMQAHVSRLVWFELAEHGASRSGLYRITDYGLGFLRGLNTVPQVIHCRDGEVVQRAFERVTIDDVRQVVLDKAYWDKYYTQQVDEEELVP